MALRAKGSAVEVDPQASLIADLTGLAPDIVRRWLVVLAAIVVEVGSALGLYLATAYARDTSTKARQTEHSAVCLPSATAPPALPPGSDDVEPHRSYDGPRNGAGAARRPDVIQGNAAADAAAANGKSGVNGAAGQGATNKRRERRGRKGDEGKPK